jgi:hypothetical protein
MQELKEEDLERSFELHSTCKYCNSRTLYQQLDYGVLYRKTFQCFLLAQDKDTRKGKTPAKLHIIYFRYQAQRTRKQLTGII